MIGKNNGHEPLCFTSRAFKSEQAANWSIDKLSTSALKVLLKHPQSTRQAINQAIDTPTSQLAIYLVAAINTWFIGTRCLFDSTHSIKSYLNKSCFSQILPLHRD